MKQRQIDSRYDADERNRFGGMKAVDYMRGFMPQYQQGYKNVTTQYGMPEDPMQKGLAAAFGAYSNFAGGQGGQGGQGQQPNYDQFKQFMDRYNQPATGGGTTA